jgi:hypothetical protein
MPDKFKQSSQWRVFAEMIETYLSQLMGSGRVHLNYVIRKLTDPIPEAAYETDAKQAVAIAPLVGEQYNRDNNKVYGILKQLVSIQLILSALRSETQKNAQEGSSLGSQMYCTCTTESAPGMPPI